MHKIASAAVAATLAGIMAIPAPAVAQDVEIRFGQQDRFVRNYCDRSPNLRGCNDFKRNRHKWDRDDYRRWYRWNQPSLGTIGAGLFGFAVGAAIANSINNDRGDRYDRGWSTHVARCEARYRSYNPETDMFLGYDGEYHRCRL